MTRYKVHNKGLWQQIVDGTVKGLSIEAFTNVVKSNNDVKLNINMNKLDVARHPEEVLKLPFDKEIEEYSMIRLIRGA